MVERTKHEIKTPYGVVFLALHNKTQTGFGAEMVEFTSEEHEALQLRTTDRRGVTSTRRIWFPRFILVRSPYTGAEWVTSTARALYSAVWYQESSKGELLDKRDCAISDGKVSKVTDYLKALIDPWMAAHPIEVTEARVQDAQENREDALQEVENSKARLAKAEAVASNAAATLEQAERRLDSLRQLPPIEALQPFVAPTLLEPRATSPSTHSRGFAAGEGRE